MAVSIKRTIRIAQAPDASSPPPALPVSLGTTPSGWSTRREAGGDGKPFPFQPGQNLIPGWTEGVLKMREGERAKIHVPPKLGYGGSDMGSKGSGWFIPANSREYWRAAADDVLTFEYCTAVFELVCPFCLQTCCLTLRSLAKSAPPALTASYSPFVEKTFRWDFLTMIETW